jgi:hypothetical protein
MFPFRTLVFNLRIVVVDPCLIITFIFIVIQRVLADIPMLNLCSSVTCLRTTLHNPYKSLVCSDDFTHGPITDLQVISHFMNSHPSVIQNYSKDSVVDVYGHPCHYGSLTSATIFELVNPVIHVLLW